MVFRRLHEDSFRIQCKMPYENNRRFHVSVLWQSDCSLDEVVATAVNSRHTLYVSMVKPQLTSESGAECEVL